MSELIDRQLVVEIGFENAGIGRPSVMLSINPKAGFVVSAEVGADFISVISTDFSPHVTYKLNKRINPNESQKDILDQLMVLLRNTIIENSSTQNRLLGVAVGVPGLVDHTTGTLLFAPNLNISDLEVGKFLHDEFPVPIFVDNEANLAVLGEYYFGAARGYKDVLYISAGVGIGGGIILNGRLMRGKTGFAGEFGHMTMDSSGEVCGCGNRGCWETQASQRALFDCIRKSAADGKKTILQDLTRGNLASISMPNVVEAATNGDNLALSCLHKIGEKLGIGIASLINILNPELVIFGGPISLAWEFLSPLIDEQIYNRTLNCHRKATKVVLARHGADACVIGGVAAVYHQILARPSDRPAAVNLPIYFG